MYRFHLNIPGFTLSELLIALAILGIIASFAITKIMGVIEDHHKKSVLKETFSILNDIIINGSLSGELHSTTKGEDVRVYVREHLNLIKIQTFSDNQFFYLPNGSSIRLRGNGSSPCIASNTDQLASSSNIDYNGRDEGPNVAGEDILNILITYGEGIRHTCEYGGAGKLGVTVVPTSSESVTLFKEIFK